MEGMNKLPNTHIYFLIPARSRSGRITDAKTGPKLSEQWSWKALRHDVRELMRGRHMEDPDLTQGHLLTDEVDVNLDVLRAPMMYRIGCHVYCTHIITVDNSGRSERDMKLLEKLAQPATFSHSMSYSTILRLSTGSRHRGLALGGPRH